MATSSKTRKPASAVRKSPARQAAARKEPVHKRPTRKVPVAKVRPPAATPIAAARPGDSHPGGDKPKKPKLVRDSFTIPKSEFMVLQELKQRVGKAGVAAKKSEILRAGIKALAAMNDNALAAALAAVPAIKTGRPAKD